MIFTLEALQAKHGDSLLLHYGEKTDPEIIIIDGGPSGVFDISLRPRLEQIKKKRSPESPLPVRLLMVSHIDDDHINGVLDLTNTLIDQKNDSKQILCDIITLWHNSFDDILGNNETKSISASLNSVVKLSASGEVTFPKGLFRNEAAAAVAASVPQGRRLRDNAERLALLINDPFPKLVILPDDKTGSLDFDGKLKLTVLCPSQKRLEKLEADWDKKIQEIKDKPKAKAQALAAEFIDDSVYNLSSIVVLAEAGGKKMLLTGDALGSHILESLKSTGLLEDDGKFRVDILKMPHHGSIRNSPKEFLQTVIARNYVMSANGRYGNPDIPTLELLSEVRGSDEYTIYLTNPVADAVNFLDSDKNKADKNYKVVIRQDPALSLLIDLDERFDD